jgi:ABC-type sugar transport system substrate-binding protein
MKKLRFIVSLITDDNDYQKQRATAAQEAAIRLGVDLEAVFASNDPIHQGQQLLDIIQTRDAGVDGILVEPASRTAFPKVAPGGGGIGHRVGAAQLRADYLTQLRASNPVPAFVL